MSHPLTPQIVFAFESFMLDCEARQLRPATLRYYRQQLTWFLTFAVDAGADGPEGITAFIIRSYLASLQHRDLSPASVQSAARAIRAFCNFLVGEEIMDTSPMKRIRMPRADRKKPDSFSKDEVRRLLNVANCWREKAAILCLIDSGCRSSEFVAWNIGDVNIATGTVRVRHTKVRDERTVYLGNKSRQALLKYLVELPDRSPDSPIWQNIQTGERLLPNGLNQMLRRLGRRAGVMPCGPHKFRRTCATWSLANGMSIYDLRKLMGHSDLDMLLHYLDNDAGAAHKAYGAVDASLRNAIASS